MIPGINKIYISLLIFFLTENCSAQWGSDSIGYPLSYITDTRDIIKEPFHWDKNDLANATLVAGGTAFLMIYDEQIDDFVARNYNEGLDNFFHYVIAPFGSGAYTLPLLGAVYLSGVIGKNSYDKRIALLGLKAFIISAGEATVVKFMFQRHRPIDDTPPDSWQFEGPAGDLRNDGSFVSRHATTAFSVATIFADGYKDRKKWVPWVAYSLAGMVTVSRVYEREHWASDALAGACLGFVTGKFLYKINDKLAGRKLKVRIE